MKYLLPVLALLAQWACASQNAVDTAAAAPVSQRATITRDTWGIPHVSGKTDADAVFGVMYAQAEDDFNRVETNMLTQLGRLAEVEGESAIYRDLRARLYADPQNLKALYEQSPQSLKALMDAWAGGLNFYLQTHPDVKPRLITSFEPWMILSFTEGSIGGDIERISLAGLEAFYGNAQKPAVAASAGLTRPEEPTGSNGFAIAPANSASHHALLWINPHTSFFFRAEAQMTSDEGLNAYGALTWGQFFVYQGFNEKAGWMHTSSGVDNIDEFLETITPAADGYRYKHGPDNRPVTAQKIVVPYKTASGTASREFTVYRTHHGPIVRSEGAKWVSVQMMFDPINALTQSYVRTKAHNLREFREQFELHTNSSNNTVYADAEGNIAYFHSNFIPRRDPSLDWTRPVDGSLLATDWNGVLKLDESPNAINPPNGWVQNTNNWPFSSAGPNSPRRDQYPAYVESGVENPRGIHAVRVLSGKKDFTVDSLIAAAFDTAQPGFDPLLPTLLKAFDAAKPDDPVRKAVAEPIAKLRGWDTRWSVSSVPTTLAVFWGDELWSRVAADARKADLTVYDFMETRATNAQRLQALEAVVNKLTADFGTWEVPWGDVNRFQRITGDIVHPFDDAKPSIPVGFPSARWGSLASFGARAFNGSKKIYGTTGNSFLAAVEFGDRVTARAVTAGGQSGHPSSPHFNDQAERYSTGNLREVYFYPEQLKEHTERTYRPGEK